jgi:large subunit ribosomal protein L27
VFSQGKLGRKFCSVELAANDTADIGTEMPVAAE